MRVEVCDVCLGDKKLVLSYQKSGFKLRSGNKLMLNLCRQHVNFFRDSGWEHVTSEKEMEFMEFVVKVTTAGNAGYGSLFEHKLEPMK